jgi:hypothetical protein
MKKIQISILSIAILSVAFMATSALAISTTIGLTTGANASTTRAAKVAAALATRIQTAQSRAGQEIDRRVTAMNTLLGKIADMTRVSASEKTSISNFLNQQISAMTSLKAKILADTDITTLKTDVKSITDSYRIFMLIIPQGNVLATTDAMNETAGMLSTLGGKLQTRISAAQTAGTDVSAMTALLSDMNAKISDAQTQTAAAVALVTPLQPDQGDATTIAANKTAFTAARADIKTARADLATARSDAGKIVAALKALKTPASASATASTTAQ